jgi:peptide chain release factor 1
MTTTLPAERLDAILVRHDIINATLAGGPEAETFVKLSRELSELDPVVAAIRAYRLAADNLSGLDGMIGDASLDPEMRAMAEEERPEAEAAVEAPRRA